jgi:signal transduction histidine kinase
VLRSRQPAERSPQPTLADLDRLLEQSRALGISVRRHDHGEPRPLGATVERTAYRVVQEALTNVHKHAADAHTDVHVRFLPGALHVEVLNRATRDATGATGAGSAGAAGPGVTGPAGAVVPGAGWGLAGLRERVELLGGTLEAGPGREGGFGVLAAIPVAVAA